MTNDSISLDELQGKQPEVQSTTILPTVGRDIKEVSIADIKPFVEKVDQQAIAIDDIMSQLDIAVARTNESIITDIINPVKAKMYEEALGQTAINEDIELDLETSDEHIVATVSPILKTVAKPDVATITKGVVIEDTLELEIGDGSNPFSSIADNELDSELDVEESDFDEDKVEKKNMDIFKTEVNSYLNPQQDKFDLSKFTINKKPIGVSKLLASKVSTKQVADWVLYGAGRPFSISELSGQEIEKMNNPNSRNRVNTYKTMYSILYEHLIDGNKPATLEAWVKSIIYFDIKHLYFAVYKACFEGKNFVPYNCPHCAHMFMKKIDIVNMIKYATPEIQAKVRAILEGDTTSATSYKTQLAVISDTYVIGFKMPTVYSVVFENSILEEEFTEKYSDILGVISYIDDIYYINKATMELSPIDTKSVVGDLRKSVKNKIKIYHAILKTLSSDEYSNLIMQMKKVNDIINHKDVQYIYPEVECPKCEKLIPAETRDPLDMLFTRHQLVVAANS